MTKFRHSLSIAATATALVVGTGVGVVLGEEWKAPPETKKMKNPEKGSAAVEAGKKLAETNCVTCHGPQGKGNGPAAAALPTKPADWTSAKVKSETDGELFWKISNGRGPMPPWKHLSEKERWDLVAYIRSLQK
jgi:mono/diheme cytochrome c family protein